MIDMVGSTSTPEARRSLGTCAGQDSLTVLCRGITMDQLWAPWRLAYVATAKPPAAGDPCFLCAGLAENDDRRNLIVRRWPRVVAVLNRFPYNNGHLLVAPRAHKGGLADLEAE